MSRLSERQSQAIGMKRASHIAQQCQLIDAEGLSPERAAEAMKQIITSTIAAHAEALENSK